MSRIRALQTHFFLSLSAQAYSGKYHKIPRPRTMRHINSERKDLQMSFVHSHLLCFLSHFFNASSYASLPLLSISPSSHYCFLFPFLLMFFSAIQFPRGPLSLTFHFQTVAHTSTCRNLPSFLFIQLAPFLLNATPKGLSNLCCSNQLSVAFYQFPLLHFWAGWDKTFLFFCSLP